MIGICVNNDDALLVRNRGVFASLAYNERDLLKSIEEIAGDKGIKAVFDGDGGEYFKKVLKWYTILPIFLIVQRCTFLLTLLVLTQTYLSKV